MKKKIAARGHEEWAKRAATENLTTDQFSEIEVWSAAGPINPDPPFRDCQPGV